MNIFLKYFLAIFIGFPLAGLGQDALISIDLINEEDGMRNSIVNDVLLDSRGLIWIATPNGLHRYDGYSFAIYDNKDESPVKLSSYNIFSVAEDHQGNIWISTDNGINVLQPSTQTVQKYFNHDNQKYPPIASKMKSSRVLADKEGKVWILQNGHLARFSDGAFHFEYDDELPLMESLFLDVDDRIIIATTEAGGSYMLSNSEPRQLQRIPNTVHPVSGELVNPKSSFLYNSEDGAICFYMPDGKLYQYDIVTNQLKQAVLEKNSINDIIHKLLNGNININGFAVNSGQKNIVYKLLDLEQGPNDMFWLGTNLGLLKISRTETQFRLENKLSNASLRKMVELDNGDIYICGYDPFNLIKYQRASGALTFYNDQLNLWDMTTINKDTLLVIGDGNFVISLFDTQNQKYVFSCDHSKQISASRGVLVRDNGDIILVSQKNGLFQTNVKNLEYLVSSELNKAFPILKESRLNCLYSETKSIIWLGSTNAILRVDVEKEAVAIHPIYQDEESQTVRREIMDIYKTENGKLWLATDNGLIFYLPEQKKSTIYTVENGLPDNYLYSILPEDSTALWISTNNGLSRFVISEQKFYNYSEADGISYREFNRNSSLKTKDGCFYFGGLNGFTSFYPEDIKPRSIYFEPFISSYSIYNREQDKLMEYIPSREGEQTIFLDPENRNISFTIALTDYRNPIKATFDVMLQGFDDDWIYNRNRREIRYTNLDPGEYTFRVRATYSFGQTSNKEDFIHLVVVKPWYTSYWFYTLLVFLLLGSILAIYFSRISYERQSHRLRNRIANDLHDEVSNTLNNIRIVAQDAKFDKDYFVERGLDKIVEMSTYAIEHLQDVIWAIDMENRNIKYLLFRMEDNIDAILRSRQIDVDFKTLHLDESTKLNFLLRRNLLLIFKEALSNIVKHTVSEKVIITIGNVENQFILTVKNDIIKRLDAAYKTGRGTMSMTQRAMALNGELIVKDLGSSYEVILKLKDKI